MKFTLFTILSFLLLSTLCLSQSIGINNTGSAPENSAMLDVQSTTKGMLVPRMTSLQRDAIFFPADGLLVYDTDTASFWYFNGSDWIDLTSALVIDNDEDTKIEVEQSPDEDNIRFTIQGTEYGRMDGQTFHLGVPNGSIFIGKDAGLHDDGTDNNSTALGFEALKNDQTGWNNTAIGYGALSTNDAGDNNTAIGVNAMKNTHFGDFNVGVGNSTLLDNTSGAGNVAVGYQALKSSTGAKKNVAVGHKSMINNTLGEYNIAIGPHALTENTIMNNNIAIGDSALHNNGIGQNILLEATENIAIGIKSGTAIQRGYRNTLLGNETMSSGDKLSLENTIIGYRAGARAGVGENVMIGAFAGENFADGERNVFVGNYAGQNNVAEDNTFIGYGSGKNNEGSGNVFIGFEAGENFNSNNELVIDNSPTISPLIYGDFDADEVQINGSLNINDEYDLPSVDGNSNEFLKTDGAGNTSWSTVISSEISDADNDTEILVEKTPDEDIIHFKANGMTILTMSRYGQDGYQIEPSPNNTLFGNNAGSEFSPNQGGLGLGNTAIGARAGEQNQEGVDNVYLGEESGQHGEDNNNNLYVGTRAGQFNGGSNNVFIGYEAGKNESGSNKLIIDNTNTSTPLIKGDFSNDKLTINGILEIGNEYIFPTTDGGGNTDVLKTDGSGNLYWGFDSDGPWNQTDSSIYYSQLNVGIGTVIPDNEVTVKGNKTITDGTDGIFLDIQNASNNTSVISGIKFRNGTSINTFKGGLFYQDKASFGRGDILFVNNDVDDFVNATAADAVMTIQNDGDVIIGKINQATGYKLSVDGKMACEEVLVELSADWPDYVFKEDYPLMPLNQVEKFIQDKGHLPNIPSALDMEENGLEIGEMNRNLMEKVEELTLYIIELDKQNKVLNKKLENLESTFISTNK